MSAPAVTETATATHLVEVEFKGNRRAFYQWSGDAPPAPKAAVIVQVDRGEDLGRIHSTGELAAKRKAGTAHGKASPAELPRAVRLASKQDVDRAVRLRADEHAVRKAAIEFARELKLDLKISDTEWQWDRRKLTCFFTAEERVDFRELVRRLEKRFSTRVHMWHIGVRDEARRLDGIGRCGRQFCSSSWLPELRPVKSSTAKDQKLSTLNPSQISGTCGRLMCCLRHEHEFYVAARRRFPKEGKVIATALGEEKVVSNDIFRDLVTLRTVEGESRTIPLAQLRAETAPGTVPTDEEAAAASGALLTLQRAGERDDDEHDTEMEDVPPRRAAAADSPRAVPPRTAPPVTGTARPQSAAAVPAATPAATPDGDTEDDAADEDGTGPDAPQADAAASPDGAAADGERRRRRRRGRRGGRRSRGNAAGGSDATGAPPDSPPDTDG